MNVFEVRLKSGKAKVSLLIIYRILIRCKIIFQEIRRLIESNDRIKRSNQTKSVNLQSPVPLPDLYRLVGYIKTTKTVQTGLKFRFSRELYKIMYLGYKMIRKSISAVFFTNAKPATNKVKTRKTSHASKKLKE